MVVVVLPAPPRYHHADKQSADPVGEGRMKQMTALVIADDNKTGVSRRIYFMQISDCRNILSGDIFA
jgi:hypothetical protein